MQLFINILISTAIYLLVANSVLLLYSTTKFLNLAHAVIITLGAYFSYLFSLQLGLTFWLSIPLAIICSITLGAIIEMSIFYPLRKKSASALKLMIASLGIYIVLQNVISILWGNDTLTLTTWEIKTGNKFLGAYITDIQIIILLTSVIFFIGTVLFLNFTKDGKKMRAVSSNEMLSNIFGINSNKVILSSVTLGSFLAAVAGILVAFNTDMSPTMGFNLLLYGIIAMIIGGVGSTWGLIGGSFLLAFAQHLGAYYIDSKWMDAITYLILILFLIWKPLGFSGKRLKKVEI